MEQTEVSRLYRLYAQDVFRLALSYLHSRQDAEDICQSVFLKALDWSHPPAPEKEKAWLLTCTANACRNHLKSFWHRNVRQLDDSVTFSEESDRELWDAVQGLAPKYRAVIHLYYYEGYSQGEIAQILHISQTAVQTRMSRARAQLKEVLNV